jgi:MATE family multidrug resistance protein
MALTAVPMMGVAVWRNVLGALGRPRVFLVVTCAALPANAVANHFLMFGGMGGPVLGLAGAGLATALVSLAMVVALSIYVWCAPSLARFRFFDGFTAPRRAELAALVSLGLPIGLYSIGEVGVFLVSTVLAGFFGAEALAAHAIALRCAGVAYAVPLGLSQAATVRVAYAVGRGDAGALLRAGTTVASMGAVAGAALFALLLAAGPGISHLFFDGGDATSPAIAATAVILLALLGTLQLGSGVGVTSAGALRGLKDTRAPMVIGLAGFWGVGMSTAAVAAFFLDAGVVGVWIGLAAGAGVSGVLTTARLLRLLRGQRIGEAAAPAAGLSRTLPA